jgi:hypothetical protein
VGAVHVEQVHLSGHFGQRRLRGKSLVPNAVLHAGAGQVRAKRLVVALALVGGPLDLLRPAVVAGVRVDRHHLGVRRRRHRQDDRRASVVAADLDHARTRLEGTGASPEPLRLLGRHPALDVRYGGERVLELWHQSRGTPLRTTSDAT